MTVQPGSKPPYEQYVYVNRKDGSIQMSLGRWKRHPDSKWPKSWAEYGVVSTDFRPGDEVGDQVSPEIAFELSKELTE